VSARRPWAWPLVPFYAAGLAAKDGLRTAKVLKTQQLAWPVVSVGSLSAGGAGKTPIVIALAEILRARGRSVDVLSRGYGRAGQGVGRVDAAAEDAAQLYGDEPVLIARRAGVPVWVANQRYEAGHAAEIAGAGIQAIHLLDDGFQHRQLARAVDVVLVTGADLDDSLLPAGNLREPLSALRRADVVAVREDESDRVLPRLKEILPASAAVWEVRRRIGFAVTPPSEGTFLPFCGIARPKDFLRDLRLADVGAADAMMFPDHHSYTMQDVESLIVALDYAQAAGFITTEKDAVKLTVAMRERLESRAPLTIARLETRFIDEDRVMRDIEAGLK